MNPNYSSVLKKRPGLSFGTYQAVLGYTGQAMLGSKFQMRDTGLSLSTKEYVFFTITLANLNMAQSKSSKDDHLVRTSFSDAPGT